MNFSELLGKTITKITGMEKGRDEIIFTTNEGRVFRMYHDQDCCEVVDIDDVVGSVDDLIGHPILLVEESVSYGDGSKDGGEYGSHTWTFYKLATIKGYVDIKWYGESNGYYSESVDFEEVK